MVTYRNHVYGSCKPPWTSGGGTFGVRHEKYTNSDKPHLSVIIFGPKIVGCSYQKGYPFDKYPELHAKTESTTMIANCLMRIIERDFSPHKMENPHTIGIYPVHHYPCCLTRTVCTVCVNMFLVHMCIYIYMYIYICKWEYRINKKNNVSCMHLLIYTQTYGFLFSEADYACMIQHVNMI